MFRETEKELNFAEQQYQNVFETFLGFRKPVAVFCIMYVELRLILHYIQTSTENLLVCIPPYSTLDFCRSGNLPVRKTIHTNN